jgi:uncharacterized repeat protein (TIGR03806 family)
MTNHSRVMFRRTRARWLAVSASALLLVACGGGSSDSGTGSTPPPATDSTPPSKPSSLKVSVVSATRIDLSWSASSDSDSGVAHYEVYRNDATTPLAEATTTSYSDRAVKPGTRYSYRVSAVDMAGNVSDMSATAAVETPPEGTTVDTTPPAAPTGVMIVEASASQIEISWSAAIDGESAIENYRIFRNGSDVALATPTATSYTDDSVEAGKSYSYAITAIDTAGNESPLSDAVGATTPTGNTVDTTPPSAPGNVKATAKSETRIEITWSESSDAESAIIGYRIYRNGSQTARATVQGTRYLDTGLDPGKSYTYVVRALDGADNLSAASAQAKATTPALVDVTAPSTPTNLKAVANTATRVDLSWAAASDSESGVAAYQIFRDGSGSALATVSGTTFADRSVHADTQYSYVVRAVDAAGNVSNASAAASVKTPAAQDTTAPSVPTNVKATAKSATQVDVTWSASTDSGSGVAKYRLFRNGSSSALATVTGTTYSDKSVVADTQYSYTVRAVDVAGNVSNASAAASVKTPSATQVAGLDVRPANASCIAPARGSAGTGVAIQRAFPNLTFKQPLGMMQAPGDASRWFVLERAGRVRVFDNDATVSTASTFLDVSGQINTSGEGGLLGMAFDPKFATNHTVYVSYTGNGSSTRLRSVIARFTSPDGGLTLNPNSEQVLLTFDQPRDNHNGGNIAFGPDGYLYVGFGDGGGGGDPDNNAQNTKNLFGAMLRIDVNNGSPYGIPGTNPFAGNARCTDGSGSASCPEIYAWGLRNPWRWSFDKSSGDLWVADVGQGSYEEVDRVQRGGNYGWRCREGAHNYNTSGPCPAGMIDPVAEYSHNNSGASITGGYVYRGKAIGDLAGRYVLGDYINGKIWKLEADSTGKFQRTQLLDTSYSIASFGQGNDGEIYAVDIASGRLHKLVPSSAGATDPVPDKLSATGCFDSTDPRKPKAGLIPDAPNAPFWSDNAVKTRWIAVPDAKQVTLKASGDFDFPAGSVLVKEFQLTGKRIETRLLMRHPDGVWAGYTYKWNDAQTEATRVRGGATAIYGTQTWTFPSEGQCLECHTQAAGRALGPETVQLNGDFKYPSTGRTANQMYTLSSIGLLSPPAADPSTLDALPDPFGSAPLTQRARAYLHTNCAQCHRSGGPTPSSMDLRYDTALSATNTCNVVPSAGDLGIADARLIAPGDPARSVLLERMQHRDANGMPPLGSNIADSKGAALLSDWIASLSGC